MAVRTEFEPGQRVVVQVPRTHEELSAAGFVTVPYGGRGIMAPLPSTLIFWKETVALVVMPEVKPKNLVEKVLFSSLLDGPHVLVKIGEKEISTSKYLIRQCEPDDPC